MPIKTRFMRVSNNLFIHLLSYAFARPSSPYANSHGNNSLALFICTRKLLIEPYGLQSQVNCEIMYRVHTHKQCGVSC